MSITAEAKQKLVSEYATKENDSGSPEVQVAILTTRIANLSKPTQRITIPAVVCSNS